MDEFVHDESTAGSAGSEDLVTAAELAVVVTETVAVVEVVVNAVPAVNIRVVVPLAELGPARTASDTGCPLCSAADTCDRSAFCWASVPPATFHVPAANADARPGAIPLPDAVTRVPDPPDPGCPVVTTYTKQNKKKIIIQKH